MVSSRCRVGNYPTPTRLEGVPLEPRQVGGNWPDREQVSKPVVVVHQATSVTRVRFPGGTLR
jgi:hypothetical protein